ncbi:vascular endothelial growth factor C-like [Watersipora subatra]|uniref:vascular endothelial growth factor C-like n=1 Tax=Watersipora subatra TaxID=2589382 RepID=UPI00355C5B6F
MRVFIVAALATFFVVVTGETAEPTENITLPEMPLSLFRSSGMAEGYANEQVFVAMFLKEFETEKGSDDKDDVSKILRSELQVIDYKQADCRLYQQIYELPNDKPNVKMYPSCVLLNRCGGCPGHSLLACKPTTTEKRQIKVIQHIFDGVSNIPVPKVAYIEAEEHTACEQRCKREQTDCNSTIHNYDSYDCKCTCKPDIVEVCPSNKRWNEDVCACECALQTMHCGPGYYYNRERCRCEADVKRSRQIIKSTTEKAEQLVTEAATTPEPCASLRCPRRYESVLTSTGECTCRYMTGRSRAIW